MTFPVVIEGSGQIYGEIKLLGFADEKQRTVSDASFESKAVALDAREIEYFAFVMRQLREFLGASAFLRRSKHLVVAITDGGYLSYCDVRKERVAVAYQLLREGMLPISEAARRLILEDALINAVYSLQGDKYCRGLQRYVDRFANPAWPLWYARQQVVTTLAGLHRYLHLDLENQILLRDAYEQIELGDGERQPYAQMLRELQGSVADELPDEFVGRVIGLISMTPDLFPEFVDKQLLTDIEIQFADDEGILTTTEEDIYKWMLEEHRQTRDVSEVLWREHIDTALSMERCLKGINLRHNRAVDVLRRISGQAPIHALADLYLAGEGATILDDFCRPVEEFCRELQANLSFGLENIKTYIHLVFNWVAELNEISRYPGDRVEFLEKFADRLKKADCITAEYAARAYADSIDEELRFLARQRAADERAEAFARERSEQARARLTERLEEASQPNEISAILRESLVVEHDFLVEDARGALNDVVRRYYELPELSQQLLGQLELQARDSSASDGFREAIQKRYSLTHDRRISYKGMDATKLFEIFTNLLVFEDNVPELEDTEGKLDIRHEALQALQKEKGILRKLLFSKKTGWVDDLTTGELGTSLNQQIEQLRLRADSGKLKSVAELADAHFRIGMFAAVHDRVDEALTHMREVVRLTLTDELIEHMDRGHLTKNINAAKFKLANKWFRAHQAEIGRAKAAGNYLELHANKAQRYLDSGRRPQIEPDQFDKLLDTLETDRVLGDKAPNHKVLRYLPRIETIGRQEYRIRDLLPAGAGGQAGQMALLKHVFADEPFSEFMGYKIVETEKEDKSIGRYMTKVGINEYVRSEYLKVFPRLFPNFEAEMVRQRNGLPNQIFTAKYVSEFVQWLAKKSREDVVHIRTFDAAVVEVVEKAQRFPLLMLEFVPGLSDDLPKTIYAHQADAEGNLPKKQQAMLACEKGINEIREQIAARITLETGLQRERIRYEHLQGLLARVRAHSAALATLFMNVDHQLFTVDGSMIAMDYEILFAPCFDPEWEAPLDPGEPVSTYFTKRINVSWVSDRDDIEQYAEVAALHQEFVREHADVLMDWAMEDAGFLLSEAGAVKDLLVRNSGRLVEDLQTLVECGGTVYLSPNLREDERSVEYGTVIPRNELRRGHGMSGLAALLAGGGAPAAPAARQTASAAPAVRSMPSTPISEMTNRLTSISAALASSTPLSTQQVGDADKTMDLRAGAQGGAGDDDDRTMALTPDDAGQLAAGDDDATMNLTGPEDDDDEKTLDLRPQVAGDDNGENTLDLQPDTQVMQPEADEKTLDLRPELAGDEEDDEMMINLRPKNPDDESDDQSDDQAASVEP